MRQIVLTVMVLPKKGGEVGGSISVIRVISGHKKGRGRGVATRKSDNFKSGLNIEPAAAEAMAGKASNFQLRTSNMPRARKAF